MRRKRKPPKAAPLGHKDRGRLGMNSLQGIDFEQMREEKRQQDGNAMWHKYLNVRDHVECPNWYRWTKVNADKWKLYGLSVFYTTKQLARYFYENEL